MPDALDTTDEYVKLFREVNTKYSPGVDFDTNVLVGMNAAMLTVQALRAAGQNPTRRSLITAMERKGSTFASAAYGNLAVSRTSRAGFTGYWFGKFNLAGALIPLDAGRTVYTTDSGAGSVTKASAKRAALPAKGIPTNS
jgi:branched-chain amino acid transport system substrate-binding protein